MLKTMLITGGAGFIGGTFVRRFVREQAYRIVNLDLLTYAGNLASLKSVEDASNYTFVHGDIRDESLVRSLFETYQPDGVLHFAAESHVDRSIGAPATFIETNVLGTQSVLEAARGYWGGLSSERRESFRFVHVSTDEVYGSLGSTGRFTESTPYAPNSPYSASKAGSDHLVRAYYHTYGMPVLISNCSNNYGPFQFPEKLIPLMILNAVGGKPLPVYGDGTNVRDWLHVEDHCEALHQILANGRPGEVYNIGGDAERTNLEVVHTICDIVDELRPDLDHRPSRSLIQFVTDRPGHDQRYAIDASKLQNELGWRPAHDFESGIRETIAWYLQETEWIDDVTTGNYQGERLGLLRAEATSALPKHATRAADEYVEGAIHDVVIKTLTPYGDDRGWLVELFRNDELDRAIRPVMGYVSETNPGVVRGPHEHVEQTDYFVFAGPGNFDLFLWDSRPASPTYGVQQRLIVGKSNPVSVVVPPGVVHAYRNHNEESGWVFNAPNRLYAGEGKAFAVDEIRHEDEPNSPYTLD